VDSWDHAAEELNRRMEELGMSQTRLAQEAKVSAQLVRDLRKGVPRSYRAAGLARIAVALGWPHDAFQRLRTGGPAVERRRLPHDVRTSLHLASGMLLRRLEVIEREVAGLRSDINRYFRVEDVEEESG
jgi:transcriptional regulator with XRE-family HTH domain